MYVLCILYIIYNRHAMVFVFSIFLPRRLILSFRKLFLFMRSRMFGFPPTTPLTDGRPYTTPPRPCTHYSAHQVIYSLSSRPSRNWKIHPSTRDKTGHIHGSVWFPNLCAATKNLVGDLLLRSRSPSPAPPRRWPAIVCSHTRPSPPLRSSSLLCSVCSDRLSTSPSSSTRSITSTPSTTAAVWNCTSLLVYLTVCIIHNNIIKTPEHNKSSTVGRPRRRWDVKNNDGVWLKK